jgi:hypothetical protein
MDGGSDEGTDRKVYGSVTAVGMDRNGETVNGTWASKGCGSEYMMVSV